MACCCCGCYLLTRSARVARYGCAHGTPGPCQKHDQKNPFSYCVCVCVCVCVCCVFLLNRSLYTKHINEIVFHVPGAALLLLPTSLLFIRARDWRCISHCTRGKHTHTDEGHRTTTRGRHRGRVGHRNHLQPLFICRCVSVCVWVSGRGNFASRYETTVGLLVLGSPAPSEAYAVLLTPPLLNTHTQDVSAELQRQAVSLTIIQDLVDLFPLAQKSAIYMHTLLALARNKKWPPWKPK
jgi:hypothetical protein